MQGLGHLVSEPVRVAPDLHAPRRRLLDLEFDALLVGDGTSILRDAKLRLKELIATFPRSGHRG